MIKLYLFERNVFTAIFFTPLSQQVIRNHISEKEKSTKMRFFMEVNTQVGGEIGHSKGKNLGSKGPPCYIQPRPLTWRALAGLECIGILHYYSNISDSFTLKEFTGVSKYFYIAYCQSWNSQNVEFMQYHVEKLFGITWTSINKSGTIVYHGDTQGFKVWFFLFLWNTRF